MSPLTVDSYTGWLGSGTAVNTPLEFETPGPYAPSEATNYGAPAPSKNDSSMLLSTLLPGLLGQIGNKKQPTDMSATIAANNAALSGGNNTALYIGLAVLFLMMIVIFFMMNR